MIYVFLFVISLCSALRGDTYASPVYTLSFPDQTSCMPAINAKTSPLGGLTLITTVYETSAGLKDLLYVTTQFSFKEEGKTVLDVLAGPAGSKLGARSGLATFLYKGQNTLMYLHKDAAFKDEFTNILYLLSETTGELIATQGSQYVKCYVRIEQSKGEKETVSYTD